MDYVNPKPFTMYEDETASVKFENVEDFRSPRQKTKALVRITDSKGKTKDYTLITSNGDYWFEMKTGNLAEGELSLVISRAYWAWINGAFDEDLPV
jgi:hypothetical protein